MLHILVGLLLITLVAGRKNCTKGFRVLAADGCNICECMENGTLAFCSQRDCNSGLTREFRTRGDIFWSKGEKCIPNSKALAADGCNICDCTDEGTLANCTQKDCKAELQKEFRKPTLGFLPGGKNCIPNSKALAADGCNICDCTDEGALANCTQKDCKSDLHEQFLTPTHGFLPGRENCTKGSRILAADGCNICECMENGTLAFCSQRDCNSGLTREFRSLGDIFWTKGEKCIPNSKALAADGCNICDCTDEGTLANCTQKDCKAELQKEFRKPTLGFFPGGEKCTPNSKALAADGCNICDCTDEGALANCTQKDCKAVLHKDFRNPTRGFLRGGQNCIPNSKALAADGCNICDCTDEGALANCTQKDCKAVLHEQFQAPTHGFLPEGGICSPGTEVLAADGCNTCVCMDNGTLANCTHNNCIGELQLPDVHKKPTNGPVSGENCTPGTKVLAADGCNICRCMADYSVAGCTRRNCSEVLHKFRRQPRQSEKDCIPGKPYLAEDRCTVCYCEDRGTVIKCTKASCPRMPIIINNKVVMNKKAKECDPFERFIPDSECNYCSCSADGRNMYFCTLMFCYEIRSVKDEPCIDGQKFKSIDGCNECECKKKLAMCSTKKCYDSGKKAE